MLLKFYGHLAVVVTEMNLVVFASGVRVLWMEARHLVPVPGILIVPPEPLLNNAHALHSLTATVLHREQVEWPGKKRQVPI